MIEVIPSVPTADPNEARELLGHCEGVCERFSLDIIDGRFANNKTVDPSVFDDVETSTLLDFQLMVVEPINWVERCKRAGADRVIGHIEHMSDQMEFIIKVQELGLSVGLGIDLPTAIAKLDPEVLPELDVVLLMSVQAGFGGQKFDERVIDKIKDFNLMRTRDRAKFKIHIDGGITTDNINDVRIAGADEVSIGKRIFEGDLLENLSSYRKAAGG